MAPAPGVLYNIPIMNEQLYLYASGAASAGLILYFILAGRRPGLRARPLRGSAMTRFGENIRLRDLFRLAVLLEEEGLAFYLKMAEKASVPAVKELCLELAGEEVKHRDLLQGQLDSWSPLAVHPARWSAFLEKVKKEGFFGNPPGEGASEKEMAAYAISQEIKSAEFYGLFEQAFPDAWKRVEIHRLVVQERAHEARLRAAYPGAA